MYILLLYNFIFPSSNKINNNYINIFNEKSKYVFNDLCMINMKKWVGIFWGVILLLAGFSIAPATGSTIEAGKVITEDCESLGTDEIVEVYFWDCTGEKAEKTVFEFTDTEWNKLCERLREIRQTSQSIEESFNAQISILSEMGINKADATYESLEEVAKVKYKNKHNNIIKKLPRSDLLFNSMCSINFELDTGTTYVLGLNTFINLVGFNIISFHNGHTPDGIVTRGSTEITGDPGDYIGSMFGFLGYWFGTKTGSLTYSDLVVVGFTVLTFWISMT